MVTAGILVIMKSQFCTCHGTQTSSDDVMKKLSVISKYKNKSHQMKLEHQNIGISRIILRLIGQKIEDSTSENRGSYQNI